MGKAQCTPWALGQTSLKRMILGGAGMGGRKLHPVYSFITLVWKPGKKRNVCCLHLHSGCLIQFEALTLALGGLSTPRLARSETRGCLPLFCVQGALSRHRWVSLPATEGREAPEPAQALAEVTHGYWE